MLWANSNLLFSKLVGMVLAAVACAALFAGYRPHGYRSETADVLVFGRSVVGTSEDQIFPMWAILAMALLIFVQASRAHTVLLLPREPPRRECGRAGWRRRRIGAMCRPSRHSA